ncbi:class I SAM-dependent methyltransferase [Brumimicrobium aurantiacum]|uniref:SAM-dependent methyltransferase n=1 Tax=Brumimicrobium aurantiacum TaxID=1737063 RepID=A0A3E1EXX5_9FLAO|nr:class I SAM-dependent methyltransferase [Brumimicrobium aurantiacum]RFC54402.1 SAM-dependent methyltransferase [Brumimicrobium aurantiacum]
MAEKTYSEDWSDYELIDAGNERKLERWGNVVTIRPERQAYFKPGMPVEEWNEIAHLEFVPKGNTAGKWIQRQKLPPEDWKIKFKDLTFNLETTKFKHVGLFPEQATNWNLILKHLSPGMKMLNLFAYTGAASIVGKSKGADVTHVDSVKQLISWARTNMEDSQLEDIRWIHEDAMKFAERALKRGNQYHLIVMDPPAWGIGAKKEKWKIEQKLEGLIEIASKLLLPGGLLILNTYSPKVKLKEINYFAKKHFEKVELSELWKKTYTGKDMFFGHLLRAYKN